MLLGQCSINHALYLDYIFYKQTQGKTPMRHVRIPKIKIFEIHTVFDEGGISNDDII